MISKEEKSKRTNQHYAQEATLKTAAAE